MLLTPESPGGEAKEPGFAGAFLSSSVLVFEPADLSSGKGSPGFWLTVKQRKDNIISFLIPKYFCFYIDSKKRKIGAVDIGYRRELFPTGCLTFSEPSSLWA